MTKNKLARDLGGDFVNHLRFGQMQACTVDFQGGLRQGHFFYFVGHFFRGKIGLIFEITEILRQK